MKISLKELRETMIWLKIIFRKLLTADLVVSAMITECDELIAIIVIFRRRFDWAACYPGTLPPLVASGADSENLSGVVRDCS